MAFIETQQNQIVIHALLTKRGRQLFASGLDQFAITKFAVSDDDIDYSYSGLETLLTETPENYPILEPVLNGGVMMKNLLFTDPNLGTGTGRFILPLISIPGLSGTTANILSGNTSITFTPATLDATQLYKVEIRGGEYSIKDILSAISTSELASSSMTTAVKNSTTYSIPSCSFFTIKTATVSTIRTFSITVTGLSTNASVTYSITITPASLGYISEQGVINS